MASGVVKDLGVEILVLVLMASLVDDLERVAVVHAERDTMRIRWNVPVRMQSVHNRPPKHSEGAELNNQHASSFRPVKL